MVNKDEIYELTRNGDLFLKNSQELYKNYII